MSEVTGLNFLTPACFFDDVRFSADGLSVNFEIEGNSTVTSGSQTVTGTLSGSQEVTWSRRRGFKDIQDREDNDEEDKCIFMRAICHPWTSFLISDNIDANGYEGFITLLDMATIACSCTGTPCTGFPKTDTFDVFGTIEIIRTSGDTDSPDLYKIVVSFLLNSSFPGTTACAFLQSSVTGFDGETTEMTLEDLAATPHEIEIELDNATMTAHTKLTITIAFA